MSLNVGKPTFGHGRSAKIQISLAIWIAKDAKFHQTDNEDSNQTARMRRPV